MSSRLARRFVASILIAALAALAFAALASASTVSLKCAGKGGHAKSSDGTVVCAAAPGKGRTIEGVLLDDAGKPAAGKLEVTFSNWVPQGNDAFTIKAYETKQVTANAAGKFTVPAKTTSEISLTVEAIADEKAGISAASAGADLQLQLQTKVKKLGGGRVKVTVKGTNAPLKIGITDETGYYVSGGAARKAKNGVATFNLGAAQGSFGVYVDAGVLADLFWPERPSFKL